MYKHVNNILNNAPAHISAHVMLHVDTKSPFYWHASTLIPAWISNHMPNKVWNGYVILSHTLYWMQLIIHAGIKINPCW